MITILHHNDADGRAAAAVACIALNRWEPMHDIQCIPMDYSKTVPLGRIAPGSRVVIVDFSLKPDAMKALFGVTTDVTWIDHHKSARLYEQDYGRSIPGLRDFNETPGVSGCVLAWSYFCADIKECPRILKLIGTYDTWDRRNPEEFEIATLLVEGLKCSPWAQDPRSSMWEQAFRREKAVGIMGSLLLDGHAATNYRDNYCQGMRDVFGYEAQFWGHSCYFLNVYQMGSLCFGSAMKEYEICVAFAQGPEKYTVSLYTERDDIDCAAIAKQYGGGGHRKAAGFICEVLPWRLPPGVQVV